MNPATSEESKPASAPSEPAAAAPAHPTTPQPAGKPVQHRPPLRVVLGLIAGVFIVFFGIPWVLHSLHTVSTDDAYVNSYVTFVAPRVAGQVARVLVEDNSRVKKGDVLVELDPEPNRVQLEIKKAALEAANAELVVTQASVRSAVAQTRAQRFALLRTIQDVDNQIALIRARVATWEQAKATLVLAQAEFDRAKQLLATKVTSAEEYDQKRETLDVSRAQVTQALENVYQARVALGLPAQPAAGGSLSDTPPDLDQSFSSVRQALATLLEKAAQLGIVPSSYDLSPKQIVDEFYRRDPGGDIDRIYADIVKNAPALKKAETAVTQAQRDVDEAALNLRYCTVVSEIDGVVTRRNVNPGNNVQVGQSLMAVRSLRDIWIDANFKETQLRDLRIGQRVDLDVDLYGGRRKFEGRISGFTMGTGSTLSLLPAQNATGNFVKVVQRLPVRVDVLNYNPDDATLFVGISVTPTVDLQTEPTGPNAGQYLQAPAPTAASTAPEAATAPSPATPAPAQP